MQDDKLQGILFGHTNLLDLAPKSRRQKIAMKMRGTRLSLRKLSHASSGTTHAGTVGPSYPRHEHAVVAGVEDPDEALTDLLERFNLA